LPLLSQVAGTDKLTKEQIEQVTHRIQFGGDEVVKAKDGAGSATLSMAFAGARFALNVLEASVKGTSNIVECTYVHLDADQAGAKETKSVVGDKVEYFSVPVELGPNGVQKILPIGQINDYEKGLFAAAVPELTGNISKGSAFITEGAKL
jgi:malate dehydrogenase